jgi:hypothetical protein
LGACGRLIRLSLQPALVYDTKGVIIMYPLAVFAIMLILLNGYGCAAAAVLVKTNTTFRCDGRLDECLIEDDLELAFLMNPYVSRVLANDPPKHHGNDAGNPDKAPFESCAGPKDPYGKCIDKFKTPNNHGCVPRPPYGKC